MEYFDSIHDKLGKDIINQKYIYINYWTFVHFFTGMLLAFFFGRKIKNNYVLVFIIHTVYEILEDGMYQKMRNRVLGETMVNKVWDTIAFMFGYYVVFKWYIRVR